MMAALEEVVRLWGEKEAKVATLKTEAEDGGRGGQEGQGQAEGRRDPGARPRLELIQKIAVGQQREIQNRASLLVQH